MKPVFRPLVTRALVIALLVLALAAALGGCSLRPFSNRTASTPTVALSTPAETRATTTVAPKRPTSTSDWRSTSTTTKKSTTTAVAEEHPTTGNAKAIAAKVKSSVVLVTDVAETNTTGYLEKEGTGVVFATAGSYAYIVTNNHVIDRGDGELAKRLRVTLPSGSTVTATLIGRDPAADIAVLRVKSQKVVAAVFRTDLSQLRAGDFVVAIGKARGLSHPVISGNVSGLLRGITYPNPDLTEVDEVISSDVPLVEGFSGGPLLDYRGRVIGINMAKFLDEPGGYSLPADFVMAAVLRLMAAAQ